MSGTRLVGSASLVAASVLLLAGCTGSPSALPPGPSAEELQLLNERMDQQYWDAIRPAGADPEPPTVPVVRTIQSAEWSTVMVECLTEAGIPGVTEIGGGLAYDLSGEQGATADRTNFEVELFICQEQYPVVTLENVDPE